MRALTRGRRAFTAAAVTAATAVLLGAAGLVVAGGSGDARAAGGAVVLDEGELDLTPRLVDGKLRLEVDDRSGPTEVVRKPSEVVLHAGPQTLETVISPAQAALGETQINAYFLNGWENAGKIFAPEPGWNGTEAGGATQVELSGFEGPGRFAMYTYTREMDNNDEYAVQHLNSADPAFGSFTLAADQQRAVPTWGFTEEGVYRLTLTVMAGGASDTETLAVVVGDDVDPSTVLPGDGTVPTPPASPTPTPTPTTTAPTAHVISEGHVDMAARKVDGELEFQVKEGSELDHEWYEPGAVVMHVRPAAKRKIPEGYDFLGTPGDAVWWLPLQQNAGIVWPGWNTGEFPKAELDGKVSFRLDSVQGPGNIAMFYSGSTGTPVISLNSGDGLPDAHLLSGGTHAHFDWAFSAEGVYRTTFTVTATLADGTKVGDTETIAWVVGDDTDPSTVTPGTGTEPTATPTATPTPSTSPTDTAAPTTSVSESPSAAVTEGGTSGVGTSTTTSTSPASGSLASTGAQVSTVAGLAAAAVLMGGGTVFLVRRRRSAR
ncbi:choice-of-anchor M domain-containing protein [Streptomyces sp. RG80]|uniref:choice-of-anchor M domain-containing protein n=1 Tax=Streptomyces sp. RG80 TaxID=3157340 RepID=UPI0033903840